MRGRTQEEREAESERGVGVLSEMREKKRAKMRYYTYNTVHIILF